MLDSRKRYLLQKRFDTSRTDGLYRFYSHAQRAGRMTSSTPTITLYSTVMQQPRILTHLTAFLLHARYAFLQTFHSAECSDIDIFDQHQQLLIRCSIRVAETDRGVPAPAVSPAQETLPENLVRLIQALVQACPVTPE